MVLAVTHGNATVVVPLDPVRSHLGSYPGRDLSPDVGSETDEHPARSRVFIRRASERARGPSPRFARIPVYVREGSASGSAAAKRRVLYPHRLLGHFSHSLN